MLELDEFSARRVLSNLRHDAPEIRRLGHDPHTAISAYVSTVVDPETEPEEVDRLAALWSARYGDAL